MDTPYTNDFFLEISVGSDSSARILVPILIELIQPDTVVDVGCGTGVWLSHFREQGVAEITGLDGPWVNLSTLQIPTSSFEVVDLVRPPKTTKAFDLVLSLEVAEHLPADSASEFVSFLTSLGPAVAFSAAIPGQGGHSHVNEQWPDYWSRHFAAHNYVPFDLIRPRVWLDERVAYYYRQNLILYIARTHVSRYVSLRGVHSQEILPYVHPELYLSRIKPLREVLINRIRSRVRFRSRLRRWVGGATRRRS